MYAQVEKSKENKSRAVASSNAQTKNKVRQSFGFVDNRPEIIGQRKIQALLNNQTTQQSIQKNENNSGLSVDLSTQFGSSVQRKEVIQLVRSYSDKELKEHCSWAWRHIKPKIETLKKSGMKKNTIKEKIIDTKIYLNNEEHLLTNEMDPAPSVEDISRLRVFVAEKVVRDFYGNEEGNANLQTVLEIKATRRANPLPPMLKRHIFMGDFDNDKVTGYHSTQKGEVSTNRIADDPERENLDKNVYKAKVVNRNNPSKEKVEKSTFFPDDWTEVDVTAAINMRNSQQEVVDSGKKWNGLKLMKMGNTIFPYSW